MDDQTNEQKRDSVGTICDMITSNLMGHAGKLRVACSAIGNEDYPFSDLQEGLTWTLLEAATAIEKFHDAVNGIREQRAAS